MKVTKFFHITLTLLLSLSSYNTYAMLKRRNPSMYGGGVNYGLGQAYGTMPQPTSTKATKPVKVDAPVVKPTKKAFAYEQPIMPERAYGQWKPTEWTDEATRYPLVTTPENLAWDTLTRHDWTPTESKATKHVADDLLNLDQEWADLTDEEKSRLTDVQKEQDSKLKEKHKTVIDKLKNAEEFEVVDPKALAEYNNDKKNLKEQQKVQKAAYTKTVLDHNKAKKELADTQAKELEQFDKENPDAQAGWGPWGKEEDTERAEVRLKHKLAQKQQASKHAKELKDVLEKLPAIAKPKDPKTVTTTTLLADPLIRSAMKEAEKAPKKQEKTTEKQTTTTTTKRLRSVEDNIVKRMFDFGKSKIGIGALGQAEKAAIAIAQNRQSAQKLVPALRDLSAIQREDVLNAWLNVWKQKASKTGFDNKQLENGINNMITVMDKYLPEEEHLILVVRDQPTADNVTVQELYFEVIGNIEYGDLKAYPSGLKYGNIEVYYKEKDMQRAARDYAKTEGQAVIQEHGKTIAKAAFTGKLQLPKLEVPKPLQLDTPVVPAPTAKQVHAAPESSLPAAIAQTPTTLKDSTLEGMVGNFIETQVPGTSSYIQDTIKEYVLETIKQQVQQITVANVHEFLNQNVAEIKKAALDLATPVGPEPIEPLEDTRQPVAAAA